MKKWLKISIGVISIFILCIVIDIICIFAINRPLFAIRTDNNGSQNKIYQGPLYNTYYCAETSTPQMKFKGTKYDCAVGTIDIGRVVDIVDKTKDIKDFVCAEALEEFYKDEKYTYYYSCIKSKYIIVKYESGFEETVTNALKNGTITIKDLDDYNIQYYKYDK